MLYSIRKERRLRYDRPVHIVGVIKNAASKERLFTVTVLTLTTLLIMAMLAPVYQDITLFAKRK